MKVRPIVYIYQYMANSVSVEKVLNFKPKGGKHYCCHLCLDIFNSESHESRQMFSFVELQQQMSSFSYFNFSNLNL